jgi:diaminobutyrate-2-oxoglutarate transaminase
VSNEEILTHWEKGTQSSTFQLNPVAAAASLFFVDQIKNGDILANINNNAIEFDTRLSEIKNLSGVVDVRGIGGIFVVEFASAEINKRVRQLALSEGLITWECGEFGECLGLVPPLNIDVLMVEKGCEIIVKTINEICL